MASRSCVVGLGWVGGWVDEVGGWVAFMHAYLVAGGFVDGYGPGELVRGQGKGRREEMGVCGGLWGCRLRHFFGLVVEGGRAEAAKREERINLGVGCL